MSPKSEINLQNKMNLAVRRPLLTDWVLRVSRLNARSTKVGLDLENAAANQEAAIVACTVHLLISLTAESSEARHDAAALLVNLCDLVVHPQTKSTSNTPQNNEEIIASLAKSAPFGLQIITALEPHQSSRNWEVRSVANVAIAIFMVENQAVITSQHLSAIWNIFFAMTSIPLLQKVFPDRVDMIRALCITAPIYVIQNVPLASNIANFLLRLPLKVLAI